MSVLKSYPEVSISTGLRAKEVVGGLPLASEPKGLQMTAPQR